MQPSLLLFASIEHTRKK